jgi:hypothetical protein
VERNPDSPERVHIAHEILAYLREHPDAQDTLEGIVEWWLLERKISYQKRMVKEVLGELVSEGVILEDIKRDSQYHYRINRFRNKEMHTPPDKSLDSERA